MVTMGMSRYFSHQLSGAFQRFLRFTTKTRKDGEPCSYYVAYVEMAFR